MGIKTTMKDMMKQGTTTKADITAKTKTISITTVAKVLTTKRKKVTIN